MNITVSGEWKCIYLRQKWNENTTTNVNAFIGFDFHLIWNCSNRMRYDVCCCFFFYWNEIFVKFINIFSEVAVNVLVPYYDCEMKWTKFRCEWKGDWIGTIANTKMKCHQNVNFNSNISLFHQHNQIASITRSDNTLVVMYLFLFPSEVLNLDTQSVWAYGTNSLRRTELQHSRKSILSFSIVRLCNHCFDLFIILYRMYLLVMIIVIMWIDYTVGNIQQQKHVAFALNVRTAHKQIKTDQFIQGANNSY